MGSKVGIITLNGYFNYGNRLQNYALQTILERHDFNVETIIYERIIEKNNLKIKFRRFKKIFSNKKNSSMHKIRYEKFKDFTDKYINETNYKINRYSIPNNLEQQFDYFIAGSDQIWNPLYQNDSNLIPAIEYMSFAPNNKRLSYAASFGIDAIPEEFIPRVRAGLQGMQHILVREKKGVDLVREITGRQATLVLDPTLLLDYEEWLKISCEHPKKPKKNYLLTYFLGDLNQEKERYIKSIAFKNNLEIVNLESLNMPEFYDADPGQFVDFVNDACLLCTDSFHGIVFSTILETPFLIFRRDSIGPSMYSRIESLLDLLEFPDREYMSLDEANLFTMDFTKIKLNLQKEKSKSESALVNSFAKS